MNTNDTRNWQISITDPTAIVEGVEDIAQCIYTILTTIPGSDPLRPTFGSNVYQYIDAPINNVAPRLIYAVTEAIGKWEKRIAVTKCTLVSDGPAARILKVEGMHVASAKHIVIDINI